MLFYSVQKCLILGKIIGKNMAWEEQRIRAEKPLENYKQRNAPCWCPYRYLFNFPSRDVGSQRRNRGIRERVKKVNMVAGMEFFIVYMSGKAHKKRMVFPLCSCGHYFHFFDAHHRCFRAGCCSYSFKPKCVRLCVFMPLYITNCTGSTLWPLA